MNIQVLPQKDAKLMKADSQVSSSKCPYCDDSGWIVTKVDGEMTAARCKCYYTARAERINAKSGFPIEEYQRMTFDTFKQDSEEHKKMYQLAKEFVDVNAQGIGFFGRSGTGKTHLCIAICQELTKRYGLVHRYFSYRREMHNIMANYYNQDYVDQKMTDWELSDVLYIDDLLKLSVDKDGQQSQRELQILYELLNNRVLNKKTTIFSSEYSLNEITRIDEAIGSRIYEMIYPYAMKCEGDNYRIKGVKK